MESEKVKYKDNTYYVCEYGKKNDRQLFIMDKLHSKKIFDIGNNWGNDKGHIVCRKMTDGVSVRNFADKIIMEETLDEYQKKNKKTHYVVEYISDNFKDMRMDNLCVVDYATHMESVNSTGKTVKKFFPKDIDEVDVPKCIRFHVQKDAFEIVFTHSGKKYYILATSIKELSNAGKLAHAKSKLIEFAKANPDIAKEKHLLENYSKKSIRLMKQYNKIISLSNFDNIKNNLLDIPVRETVTIDLDNLCKKDRIILRGLI